MSCTIWQNHLAHGAQVRIEAYPDRLRVTNPGGLHGEISRTRLFSEPLTSSRNSHLARRTSTNETLAETLGMTPQGSLRQLQHPHRRLPEPGSGRCLGTAGPTRRPGSHHRLLLTPLSAATGSLRISWAACARHRCLQRSFLPDLRRHVGAAGARRPLWELVPSAAPQPQGSPRPQQVLPQRPEAEATARVSQAAALIPHPGPHRLGTTRRTHTARPRRTTCRTLRERRFGVG